MSGKWPIFAVLVLGLVASVCAAVLMAALKAGGSKPVAAPQTVEIVVVSGDLPGMSKIEQGVIELREVGLAEKPEGAFTDPVQVLGRVLKSGLVSGQPVVESALLRDEGGAQLASSLPPGMRAVSVEINGSSALRGLLFPGSRVDVIVSYKAVPGRSRGGAPVSRTLLQNVGVLAVEDKTVFTVEPEDGEDEKKALPARRATRGMMVTLMVEPQQARELQSARDIGGLSLSLRNPLDASLTADPSAKEEPVDAVFVEPEKPAGPWRTVVVRGGKTEIIEFDAGVLADSPGSEAYADAPTETEDRVE